MKTEYRNKNLKVSNVCKRKDKQDIRGVRRKTYKTKKVLYRKMKAATSIITLDEKVRLSEEERRVDALALRAEERRDKLRKAAGRSKYPTIRRYLNGETRLRKPQSLHTESIGMQREPGELKHLSNRRKRKKNRFPK